MINLYVFMLIIGKILEENHKDTIIVLNHVLIGIQMNILQNIVMDVRILLIVLNVMDGKNSNIIQCYSELNNVLIKIAINKIVPSIIINKKEGIIIIYNNIDVLSNHLKLEYLRLYPKIE